MSKVVSLRRPLPWNALALVPAAALSAFLLANVAGCGSGDCVIITTGTKDEYTVEIVVTSDGELGALQLEVTTDDCNGEWEGRGDQVECVALVEAITAANFAGQDALKVGLISLEGIETPAAVLRCTYRSFQAPEPSDFRVEVLDAADTESQPLAPVPVVAIGAIILVDD